MDREQMRQQLRVEMDAVVEKLSARPDWQRQPPRCLCVGLFLNDDVADFPSGVLDDVFARHRWVRNWSECAPMYGKKKGLDDCRGGMADYICSVAERPGLPEGTTRVLCHVAGENKALQDEYLQDEFNVVRQDSGPVAHPVSLKASAKLER